MRVCVIGAAGRMGRRLVKLIHEAEDLRLVGAVDRGPSVGEDAGEVAGVGTLGVPIQGLLGAGDPGDVVVDFSLPGAMHAYIPMLEARGGVPLVTGTTGLGPEERELLERLAKTAPVVSSPNFSVGVAVLGALAGLAARLLRGRGFDVEVLEAHHRNKIDAPSGTAAKLVSTVAGVMGLDGTLAHGRRGTAGPRQPGEIGVHSVRGGSVVGEHHVMFLGDGEGIELVHRAGDREIFARGALAAARWVVGQEPGVYGLEQVLGIA